MIDATTVFITVSVMMLANSAVLAIVLRDLPQDMRPAARHWQLGTLLIAGGCAVFGMGSPGVRPLMLVPGNALLVSGLTAYCIAMQRHVGRPTPRWQWLPAIGAVLTVLWFSTVTEDFSIRVAVVSVVWGFLMGQSAWTLLRAGQERSSLSLKILFGLFLAVMIFAAARGVLYLLTATGPGFAVETGAHWLNLASPIFMTILPVVGTTAFLLMCSDALRRQLERAASTDYLTGLPNRRASTAHCRAAFGAAERGQSGFAIAVLDIDNFKMINDTYGHDAGDQVLVRIAETLRRHLPKGSFVARTGGEEFVALLDGPQRANAIAAIEHLRATVEGLAMPALPGTVRVTLSAGIAFQRDGDTRFEDILRRADHALYAAKAGGRNRVEVSKPALVSTQPVTLESFG